MKDLPRQGQTKGFTLLEMIMALLIAAILLTVAVPSFQTQIRNGRMAAASNDLAAALMLTKSETLGRSEFVSICRKDPNSAACATTGGWEQGWLVFVDPDADGIVADPNSDILHEHKSLRSGITVNNTVLPAGTAITYRPNGLTNLAATETIVLCDETGIDGPHARAIIISILGKASKMTAKDLSLTTCTPP